MRSEIGDQQPLGAAIEVVGAVHPDEARRGGPVGEGIDPRAGPAPDEDRLARPAVPPQQRGAGEVVGVLAAEEGGAVGVGAGAPEQQPGGARVVAGDLPPSGALERQRRQPVALGERRLGTG